MKDLIIIGASGFGREVAWLVERINKNNPEWHLIGFIDDDENLTGKTINGYPVLGPLNKLSSIDNAWLVCAIGSSNIREGIIHRVNQICDDAQFATLIDPSVIFSERVKIGVGSIICANSILTVDVEIGSHVIINLDCTIGHDAILSDFVTVYPGVNISGITQIGEGAELGTGSLIIQSKSIGDHSIVGAGAVVIRNLPDNCTAVGNPAKPIKFRV